MNEEIPALQLAIQKIDIDRKSLHHQLEKKEKEFATLSTEYAKLNEMNNKITLLKVHIFLKSKFIHSLD